VSTYESYSGMQPGQLEKMREYSFEARKKICQDFLEGFPLVDYPDDDFGVTKAETGPVEQWPGWEYDLGLVGEYKKLIGDAFDEANVKGSAIRKKVATRQMYVSGPTMRSLIADEIREAFTEVLDPLWSRAWHLGYESAKSLVTGEDPDFSNAYEGEPLQNFRDTEGQHWVDKIAATGLQKENSRSENIARTEVARAMNAAAVQAYRDYGVTHKELALSPDDSCDSCKQAADSGVIPLDAIFPGGGLGGPLHPQCRCVPVPAGMDLIPPQSHIGKTAHPNDDPSMIAFLLFRSKANGHPVFLLQKRGDDMNNPGCWGLPGGTSQHGEFPLETAWRESEEEMGELVRGDVSCHLDSSEDDREVHIFVVDVPSPFTPVMNGSTPEETSGWGWFRKKEIKKLPLQPNFKEQWDSIHWGDVAKFIGVTENGEQLSSDEPLFPAGARWPYPHRADGAEDPHYGTTYIPEPPNQQNLIHDDMSSGTNTRVYEGDETDSFPRRRTRNRGPRKNPKQGPPMPQNTSGGSESGVSNPGSETGVPPSGEKTVEPVVGSVPATAGKPASPHAVPPVSVDPGDNVEQWSDEDETNMVSPAKKTVQQDADLANPDKPGGPSDFHDANPVDQEHVYVQMAKNFPPDAIDWVKRAKWTGPQWVPWNRIDSDAIDSWAASKQPERVKEFEKLIREHKNHVAPSVLVQQPDTNKAFIVDGHHRALAHRNLKQDVLAYIGNIDSRDRLAAEETHSKQIHHGADPKNA
jgi:8-oxo-dGTP pyrophosphatase MutT (NUDIX family)